MPVAAIVRPEDRTVFGEALAQVFSEGRKLEFTFSAPASFGQPDMQATMRLYPLLDTLGRTSLVLGTFVTSGTVGRQPRRFALTGTRLMAATDAREQAIEPIRTRGHLSLVVSR